MEEKELRASQKPEAGQKKSDRAYVLQVLLDEESGCYLSEAQERLYRSEPALDVRVRAFIRRESAGAVKRRIMLDEILNRVSKLPVSKMKPKIRSILRIGVFELFLEDRIPDHAAINEAVELAKKSGESKLSGFVNGVLRSAARQKKELLASIEKKPDLFFGVPSWIYEIWREDYGEAAAAALCEASAQDGAVSIRVNTDRISCEKLAERLREAGAETAVRPEARAILLKDVGNVTRLPGFAEGLFYVQDLSSMRVVDRIPIARGDRILDMCASPGGKSIQAAWAAGERGSVTACDKNEKKLQRIRENMERLKIANIAPQVCDATVYRAAFSEAFDVVIADLPCSGLGVLKHKPDIRHRLCREDISTLAALQRQMLKNAARYVKRGGWLSYSTCTLNHLENEQNVAWLLETQTDFVMEEQETILISDENDGFFRALLKRT